MAVVIEGGITDDGLGRNPQETQAVLGGGGSSIPVRQQHATKATVRIARG